MRGLITPILIPGLLCTEELFRYQLQFLSELTKLNPLINEPKIANTSLHDNIEGMANAALAAARGPLVAIGLSMGGYVALEMARLAPDRVHGLALLSTSHKADTPEKRHQRMELIKIAESDKFRGVTQRFVASVLSPAALADEALVAIVLKMAKDIGRHIFISQQTAILNRREQSDTLTHYRGEVTILCGLLDGLTPPELSREMATFAPHADLRLLPEIGHLTSLEAPTEVKDAVIGLLERVCKRAES